MTDYAVSHRFEICGGRTVYRLHTKEQADAGGFEHIREGEDLLRMLFDGLRQVREKVIINNGHSAGARLPDKDFDYVREFEKMHDCLVETNVR